VTGKINLKKEKKMKKMFSTMMEGFTKGMSEKDKKKMIEFVEKMAGMCSCVNWKDMSEEEKKAMKEKMMSFCSGKMETMSNFFKKLGSQTEKTDKLENA
jgi:biotin synthase-like enzyme